MTVLDVDDVTVLVALEVAVVDVVVVGVPAEVVLVLDVAVVDEDVLDVAVDDVVVVCVAVSVNVAELDDVVPKSQSDSRC